MKKRRVNIVHEETFAKITWNRVHWLDIVLMFALPMSLIVLLGNAFGFEEVFGYPVLRLSQYQEIMFWIGWVCIFYLIAFNRKNTLTVSSHKIHFRKGRFPAFVYRLNMKDVAEVYIKEKKDLGLAESDYAGPARGPFYRVIIIRNNGPRIRTDDFVLEEAQSILTTIKKYR